MLSPQKAALPKMGLGVDNNEIPLKDLPPRNRCFTLYFYLYLRSMFKEILFWK